MKEDIAYKTINEILLKEWNPIDMDSLPEDEYLGYVPAIYKKITEDINLKGLSDLLLKFERTSLGIDENIERCDDVARKLLKIEL